LFKLLFTLGELSLWRAVSRDRRCSTDVHDTSAFLSDVGGLPDAPLLKLLQFVCTCFRNNLHN